MYRSTAVVQINHETANILRIEDFEAAPRSWQGVEQFYQNQYEILRGRQLAEDVVCAAGSLRPPGTDRRNSSAQSDGRIAGPAPTHCGGVSRHARGRSQSRGIDPGTAAFNCHSSWRAPFCARASRSRLLAPILRLVNVSVSSFDPAFAARLANAVVEEYVRSTMQRRYDAGQEAREFLQDQLDEMRISLERADQNLIDFAQDNGVADLQETGRYGQVGAAQSE